MAGETFENRFTELIVKKTLEMLGIQPYIVLRIESMDGIVFSPSSKILNL